MQETLSEQSDVSKSAIQPSHGQTGWNTAIACNAIYFADIALYDDVFYVVVDAPGNHGEKGRYTETYTLGNHQDEAVIYVDHFKNALGEITRTRFTIFPQNWDNTNLIGAKSMVFENTLYTVPKARSEAVVASYNPPIGVASGNNYISTLAGKAEVTISASSTWQNKLTVSKSESSYIIDLQRHIDSKNHPSTIILKNDAVVVFENYDNTDENLYYLTSQIDEIVINSGLNDYIRPIEATGPIAGSNTITVYVRNSQTGALLADARLTIQDTTTDPWAEVVNETLSSGQGSFSLPKDTGIHLTQYRIGATVPGYQQVVPALFARVTGPTNIVVEMEPTAGGPVNETNTYLKFYVRDSAGNGVGSANIVIGDVMRYTNSQGYAQFEVAKNSTHEYTISKFRYTQVSGTATVYDDDSYTVSITLLPGAVPTYTQPGEAPTPDSRSPAEKAASGLDYLLDNAENFGIMAGMILMIYMCYWMVPKR